MVQIVGTYEGGLHVRAEHGPSGDVLETDAPADNHGRGERFSPTDLVATALGTCVLTILGIQAEKHGLDLEGARFEVTKEMASDPRRIARLPLTVTLPASVPEDLRPRLEKAAHHCPVHASLHPDVDAPIEFRYE